MNIKWNANELLDSLNRETNQKEINELYKALIAYGLGLDEIDEEADKVLDSVIEDDYFENDNVLSFVNPEIMDGASVRLKLDEMEMEN